MADNRVPLEFKRIISVALNDDKFLQLSECKHHFRTSRLQHSLGVAYVTYIVCVQLHIEPEEATIAALYHDFYLYDWRDNSMVVWKHLWRHPKVAVGNARRLCNLTASQEKAILSHMWPISGYIPHGKIGWLVCFADKYCSTLEIWKAMKEICLELFKE